MFPKSFKTREGLIASLAREHAAVDLLVLLVPTEWAVAVVVLAVSSVARGGSTR